MTITIPDCEVETVASTDQSRPVLTQAAIQRIDGEWYMVATDSYVAAAVPIPDPGDDCDEGLVPTSLIARGRKALRAMKRRSLSMHPDDAVRLTAKGKIARLDLRDADLGDVYGDLSISARRMEGVFPNMEQILSQAGGTSQVEYGTIRIAIQAHNLARVAKAIGAVTGRGRRMQSAVILDIPVNPDGTVNQRRAVRVQPTRPGDSRAIGLVMPISPDDSWPKPWRSKAVAS